MFENGLLNYCLKKSKSKMIKDYRFIMYYFDLWNTLQAQFEYEGLPDSLPAEWLEGILACNGTVGIGEFNNTLYCCAGSYTGALNGYIPEKYIGTIPAIGTIENSAECSGAYDLSGEPNKTIVVGWNNAAQCPEFELVDFANALCEGRTSEDINVIFSRLLRIPIAKNEKEKAIIESAIKAILEGKVEAVTSSISSLEEKLNGESTRQFLDLVDVKDVDKLQYLNQYMDNMYKRFMRKHGISMNITNKLAQQTNAEMHGADDYSMIYPLQQLKYRKKMIDDTNRLFGEKYQFHAKVKFSKIWQNAYDKIINYIPDELNEKGVIEKEGVSRETIQDSDTKDNAGNAPKSE